VAEKYGPTQQKTIRNSNTHIKESSASQYPNIKIAPVTQITNILQLCTSLVNTPSPLTRMGQQELQVNLKKTASTQKK
jgi:hypothetical protein